MPNLLNENGLTISTKQEIIDTLSTSFRNIYGQDINIESNSPDGQLIDILAQVVVDNAELLMQIYNTFDPDSAFGRILDKRVALNNITRRAGTYTYTPISITTNRALTLLGLDTVTAEEAYTVKDNTGNNFILTTTTAISTAGTYSLPFRAENIGKTEVLINTITNPVTVILGVTAINNPTAPTTVGVNEETDSELKTRRAISTAISARGFNESMRAALLNVADVTYAKIFENTTATIDADGIPAHSIWAIVEGGANADIAEAIYAKRTAGSGMKGSVTYDITEVDGETFTVKFDRVVTEPVYIRMNITAISGTIDIAGIKTGLVANINKGVYEPLDTSEVGIAAKTLQPNAYFTDIEVSLDGISWADIVFPSAKNKRFVLSVDNITITEI